MKIIFLSNHMKFSGGRWLMFEYAKFLADQGYDSTILVTRKTGELTAKYEATEIPAFNEKYVPDCDLIVATSPDELEKGWRCRKAKKVVHFCQGFDLIDMEHRVQGKFIPPRYQGGGFLGVIRRFRKRIQWRRTLRQWDAVYRLPTYFISVSQHLTDELERRYRRPAPLCRNGVDLTIFKAATDWSPPRFSPGRPMRIANIGPYHVTYKGIPTTFDAIRLAMERNLPVEFIRITKEPSEFEKEAPFPFRLHENPPSPEMAEIMRSCDVYISNSTEREGFGLPAMECMASGLMVILSDIQCYRSFSDRSDFALFVPEGNAEKTVAAIENILNMTPEEMTKFRNKSLEVSSTFSHEAACRRFEELLIGIAANPTAKK
jgi:glycosyltransferase involved in cell wall biosynthesis